KAFLKGLKSIYRTVQGKGIFFLEADSPIGFRSFHADFQPAEGSLVFEWTGDREPYDCKRFGVREFRAGEWIEVRTLPQRNLASYLISLGITEALICGEIGIHERERNHLSEGCVGGIFYKLGKRIDIKGVKNGMFPRVFKRERIEEILDRVPTEVGDSEWRKKWRRKVRREWLRKWDHLYGQAVELPQ
ncbi:MAG: hypothetical protein Q8L34_04045, partial [Candidatus Woesearchaeota archaeon]|nr:hypothetical protein [Candidatus Woesearchaeota archaeon]